MTYKRFAKQEAAFDFGGDLIIAAIARRSRCAGDGVGCARHPNRRCQRSEAEVILIVAGSETVSPLRPESRASVRHPRSRCPTRLG
jgi:hypothetical protein